MGTGGMPEKSLLSMGEKPSFVREIPGWPAISMWGDLARFSEHFRPAGEYGDALRTSEGSLDILSK